MGHLVWVDRTSLTFERNGERNSISVSTVGTKALVYGQMATLIRVVMIRNEWE